MKKSTEEKLKRGLSLFLENPYWKDHYENAPSDQCKLWINFCFARGWEGLTHEEDESHDLEKRFTVEDWLYVARGHRGKPFWGKCMREIVLLKAREGEDPEQIAAFIGCSVENVRKLIEKAMEQQDKGDT